MDDFKGSKLTYLFVLGCLELFPVNFEQFQKKIFFYQNQSVFYVDFNETIILIHNNDDF